MGPASRDVTSLATSLARVRPFPAVVDSIRRAAADPATGVGDIIRFLESDVGVATDLLRVANAPTSALAQKCTSIRHAASLLGLKRVVELVTSAAALAYVEKVTTDFPELASHVLGVAGVARTLAPITGLSPDEGFTAGLLHDIGVLLLVESDDPFYEGLIESTGGVEEPSVADERALMGFDHAALGAAVARTWNLPSPLPQVIGLHHDWEGALQADGAVCAMVALIRVGDALLPVLSALEKPSLDDLTPLFEEPAFAHLGLTREELYRMWEPLRRACDKANVIGTSTPTPADQFAPPRRIDAGPPWSPRPAAPLEAVAPGPRITWGMMAAAVVIVAGTLGIVLLLIH
jgi:HD-like signal output (HDOD) protein